MNIYIKKNIIQQCIVEFLGTGLIVFFGTSCLAASKFTNIHFNHFEISFIWGLGAALSIYFSYSVSGAHLNPAITIFLWLSYGFSKKKVVPYIFSQILGTFVFSIIVYYLYYDIFILFEKKYNIVRGTQESLSLASIFCIYPNINNYNFIHDFTVETFFSALFIIIILQFNNRKNNLLYSQPISPFLTGMVITIINLSASPLNNISLNPARDLGPRIFLSLHGWHALSFSGEGNYTPYFLIPVIAPIFGINLGGWIHKKILDKNCY